MTRSLATSVMVLAMICAGVTSAFAVTLSPKSVLQRTYEQSLSGKALQLQPAIAQEEITRAKSQYDTNLSADVLHTQDQSERTSTVFGTDTSLTEYNISLDQGTPLGSLIGLDAINSRETSNSIFATNSILYSSLVRLRVRQPVARNAFGFTTRRNLAAARESYEAAREGASSQLQDLAFQNLSLYWNWYFFRELAVIDHRALEATQALFAANREKLSLGLIEEPDLAAFGASTDIRRGDLLLTESNLSRQEQSLKAALDLLDAPITPDPESLRSKKLPSLDQAITQALESHPTLLSLRRELKAQNIQVAIQKNALLPQVDLVSSLELNGIDPQISSAFSNISDINPLWTAGLSVRWPIQNRAAKADYRQVDFQRTQKLYELKDRENNVIAQMRQAHIAYQKALARVNAIGSAVQNQLKKWQGEVRRYDQGRSDPDLVIRYQNDYIDAQRLHVRSQLDLQLAWLDFEYARGALQPAYYAPPK